MVVVVVVVVVTMMLESHRRNEPPAATIAVSPCCPLLHPASIVTFLLCLQELERVFKLRKRGDVLSPPPRCHIDPCCLQPQKLRACTCSTLAITNPPPAAPTSVTFGLLETFKTWTWGKN